MTDYRVTREQVTEALRRARNWLLQDQITADTRTYDSFVETSPGQGDWTDAPLARHLVGGFHANIWRNPQHSRTPSDVRRQYHSTWHTAQCAVALLDWLDYEEDPVARQAVELCWDFLQRHQVPDGPFKGVYVERDLKDLRFPLQGTCDTFSTQSPKADNGYASYDNMETSLFPLELYRRTKNARALDLARTNAQFYLDHHSDKVFFEVETRNYSISGMCNDAIYGRLARYTAEQHFYDAYVKQVRKLSFLGLDLRAANNIRNIYWDLTPLLYALDEFPELHSVALAKLAFLCEHTLGAQKESGVLWHRFCEPGVVDRQYKTAEDGAATNGMIIAWAAIYERTGDPRWMRAIRKAVHFAVTHQYPEDHHPYYAGAFEYDELKLRDGLPTNLLRAVTTAFGLRAMLPLLKGERRWARDFWSQ